MVTRVLAYQGSCWAVGVDAGGTWVRIRARRQRVVRERRVAAEGAGDAAVGFAAAAVRRGDAAMRDRDAAVGGGAAAGVAAIVRRAWRDWSIAPGDVGGLVVASRGVWTVGERRRAQNKLRGLARRVRVISDAEAAHAGALGGKAGLLILAGTGSIAIGRDTRGRWHRAGGLGPLLGDEGSAFWIGRQWLRACSRDGAGPALRGALASPSPAASIAAYAPGVLRRARRGHRVEREIVRAAQHELAALMADAGRALRLPPPWPTSWGGSLLARDAWFRAGLARAVARAGLRVRWVPPVETPVRAAERLASSMMDDA